MKIKLPAHCKGLELSDKHKTFCALMLLIADASNKEEKGSWLDTEFYMLKSDMGKMVNPGVGRYSDITTAFQIGNLNDWTMSIRFIKPQYNSFKTPTYYVDEIHEEKCILMYYYLLGRFADPSLIFNESYVGLHTDPIMPKNYLVNNQLQFGQ